MNDEIFAGLYERYSDRLRHAMTARTGDPDRGEDVTAAFAAAWENIDRFQGKSEFCTWLYRIGANDKIQNWRRHWRTVSLTALPGGLLPPLFSFRNLTSPDIRPSFFDL